MRISDWSSDVCSSDLQLYTSGTTGLPKGVVLTNANYRTFLEAATEVDGFAYGEDETVVIVMPLFHVAGTNVSFSGLRSEERRVGKECVSTCRSRWSPYH